MSVHVLRPGDSQEGADWQLHAAACEDDVRLIQRWLHMTDLLLERFDEHELRAVAALMRERRNDTADLARELRAHAAE